jgi:hypothetical protein
MAVVAESAEYNRHDVWASYSLASALRSGRFQVSEMRDLSHLVASAHPVKFAD